MNGDGPAFAGYGLGIHANDVPGLNQHFAFEDSSAAVVDPSLAFSAYSTSPESHFLTPLSESIVSPSSSVEYFGHHRGSFSGCSDTVAPHDTVHTKDVAARKEDELLPSSTTTAATATATVMSRKASTMSAEPAPQPHRTKKQKTQPDTQQEPKQEQEQKQQQQQQQQLQPQRRKPARKSAKRDDAQRSKNLERNRIAASKCRQKKKEWVHELEEAKSEMELRHTSLRIEYLQLLDEVTRIKNQLMAHSVCNDPNIDFWIEKEALRFVARCNGPEHMKRPSLVSNAPFTLPSPTCSESLLASPTCKSQGINLDYMPDELLTAE